MSILMYYVNNWLEELSKITSLWKDGRYSVQRLNLGFLEWEPGLLVTEPRHSLLIKERLGRKSVLFNDPVGYLGFMSLVISKIWAWNADWFTLTGEHQITRTRKRSLSLCYFVLHKSHIDWPWIDLELPPILTSHTILEIFEGNRYICNLALNSVLQCKMCTVFSFRITLAIYVGGQTKADCYTVKSWGVLVSPGRRFYWRW